MAKDWNDSDRISKDLSETILARPNWLRSDFDKTFGLDRVRGPELLRALGYGRRDRAWGEYWERKLDD